nr:hypothetical protein CFP56_09604 [Quercus suber]
MVESSRDEMTIDFRGDWQGEFGGEMGFCLYTQGTSMSRSETGQGDRVMRSLRRLMKRGLHYGRVGAVHEELVLPAITLSAAS